MTDLMLALCRSESVGPLVANAIRLRQRGIACFWWDLSLRKVSTSWASATTGALGASCAMARARWRGKLGMEG